MQKSMSVLLAWIFFAIILHMGPKGPLIQKEEKTEWRRKEIS